MARLAKRFTVYDVMEEKGVFDSNPANSTARDEHGRSVYSGPQEFPKMLYHPQGKTKTIDQGEAVATPFGPKMIGIKEELISVIVSTPEEEARLLAQGWHKKPFQAIAASGAEAPVDNSEINTDQIESLKKEIEKLKAEAAAANKALLGSFTNGKKV